MAIFQTIFHKVPLAPFDVPTEVVLNLETIRRAGQGINIKPMIPISSLTRETLEEMCDEFKNSVLIAAGHITPNNSLYKDGVTIAAGNIVPTRKTP